MPKEIFYLNPNERKNLFITKILGSYIYSSVLRWRQWHVPWKVQKEVEKADAHLQYLEAKFYRSENEEDHEKNGESTNPECEKSAADEKAAEENNCQEADYLEDHFQ